MRLLRLLVNELNVETVAWHVNLYQLEERKKYGQGYKRGQVAVISSYLEELKEKTVNEDSEEEVVVENGEEVVAEKKANKPALLPRQALLSSKESSGAKVEDKSAVVTSDSSKKLSFIGIKEIVKEMSERMTKQELLIANLLKKLDGNNSKEKESSEEKNKKVLKSL